MRGKNSFNGLGCVCGGQPADICTAQPPTSRAAASRPLISARCHPKYHPCKICMHRRVQGTCRTAPCCIKPHLHQAPAYAPAGVWGTSTKTLHSHAAPNWWRHQQVKEEERRRGGAWGGNMGGGSGFSRKVLMSPTFNNSWSRSNTSPIFCFWSFSCLFLSLITACAGHTR